MSFNLSSSNFYGLQILDAHDTYEDFILEHPTGQSGDVHLVGTNIYSWSPELNSWTDGGRIVGPDGPQGADGEDGADGADGTSPNLQSVAENIVPDTTNIRTLGTPSKRWADVYMGPNTLHITDTVTGADAQINVASGVIQIDGANQLQVGQLKFVDNTIESTAGSTNIQIGQTSSTANLILNRNVVVEPTKTLSTKKIIGASTSTSIAVGSTSDTSNIELNRDVHIAAGKKLSFGNGTRAEVDASLAPYGKQTVCVKTTGGKNDMYWGSCASNNITGGTDYYILATFTNT
jgi:hypothetical protein